MYKTHFSTRSYFAGPVSTEHIFKLVWPNTRNNNKNAEVGIYLFITHPVIMKCLPRVVLLLDQRRRRLTTLKQRSVNVYC